MSTSAVIGGSEKVLLDAGYKHEGPAIEDYDPNLDPARDDYWVQRARSAFLSSQTWFDTSVRRRMEDNMRLFNSDHPRGSRYREVTYEKRSRLFRPKTRSSVRKMEAATAAAFFATQDAVTTTAPNPADRMQRMAADAQGELLNMRLNKDIPWFLTCIGALQDASKQGVVISKQEWVYREVDHAYEEVAVDELTGERSRGQTTYERHTVADHPDIRLRPVENIRFSPAADWRNPIQSSPYLIDMEPYFVGDLIHEAKQGKQGEYGKDWRVMDISMVRSALRQSYDPIRQAREGNREDRYEEADSDIQEHDIVWVHHNYIRVDGQDWVYDTLGTEIMLSKEPVPLEETTPLKERPYVMGLVALETHMVYPSGLVELARPLQEEINDITNLRIDNIRHVISPRYFIKRGTSVDVRSLMRNIAGGVTAMEDPQSDVNIRQIQDTTSSSFQEHDRLAIEMDELVGNFSQSSVASNHNINERVGNTAMVGESANQVTELTIRTFSETWVEPALQQIMELERALESDEVVLAIVGERLGLHPEVVFRMLDMPVKVTVNVGFGATNPQRRLQKVSMAFTTIAEINPEWLQEADKNEVITEILGSVGFKSAERFFPSIAGGDRKADPRIQQLTQENQKLKQMIESKQAEKGQELQAKGQIEQMKIQSKERLDMAKLQQASASDLSAQQLSHRIETNKWNSLMLDHKIDQEGNALKKQQMVQTRIALNHTITMDERQYEMTLEQHEMTMRQNEFDMNMRKREQATAEKETKEKPAETKKSSGPADTTSKKASNTKTNKNPSPKPPRAGGKRIASSPKMSGDDKAGVIARNDYGDIPFKEG